MTLVEDLEECNCACELDLQGKLAELKEKKAELAYARENALECTCHVPVETSVEAKRTPSLAALCCCPPGGHQNEAIKPFFLLIAYGLLSWWCDNTNMGTLIFQYVFIQNQNI